MVALPKLNLPRLDTRASAATLSAPLGDAILPVSGTTTITSITVAGRGQLLILEFQAANCPVTNGSNLNLRANYLSSAAGDTLTLACDGTNWNEVSRVPFNLVAADFPTGPGILTAAMIENQSANKVLAGPTSGGAAAPTFRDLVNADFPAGLWSTSNPTAMSQTGALTFTVTTARKFALGKFVCYICQVTVTVAGTAGGVIAIGLPFTMAANAGQAFGAFRYDRAAGGSHFGMCTRAAAATDLAFPVPSLGFLGNNPNFATANGDVLWFSVSVETT